MTFWAHEGEWTFQEAALHGSSYYDLPGIPRWFTGISAWTMYITCAVASPITGYHGCSATIVILVGSRAHAVAWLPCVRLVLWDEDQCCPRFISRREFSHTDPRRVGVWRRFASG